MTDTYTRKERHPRIALPTPAKAHGTVKVAILAPHAHNGKDMQPGDVLALPVPIARALVESGAAKYLKTLTGAPE